MTRLETVKVKTDDGYKIINKTDLQKEDKIYVEPKKAVKKD